MEREIKFRAWDGQKMVTNPLVIHFTGEVEWPQGGWDVGGYDDSDKFKVMQYTGLKDCKGKEIYEGDIVEYYQYFLPNKSKLKTGEIRFIDGCYYFWNDGTAKSFFSVFLGVPPHIPGQTSSEWKIIGNIYSNPDLISKKS